MGNDLQGLEELPLLTPPYTGGGEVSLRLREVTKRSLPLCKGEPEGVVEAMVCAPGMSESEISKSQNDSI